MTVRTLAAGILTVAGGAVLATAGLALIPAAVAAQATPQNPSPMVERTRTHERLPDEAPPGIRFRLEGLFERPVHVFVPAGMDRSASPTLLIHFHGAAYVAEHAVAGADRPYVVVAVNAGAGSAAYERPFRDPGLFEALVQAVASGVREAAGMDIRPERVVLSGFSAGYGAVRAVLRSPDAARIGGIILLDGLHTGYDPPATGLHDGGTLDAPGLAPFVDAARAAVHGGAPVLITHSEVFPGTFASTTECTNHILDELGLRRTAVLEWGPVGMQQLGEARSGRLLVQGFAGNSAPDHMDHLHGLPEFLRRFDSL
ncbi:MAG TPA: hypothetical protein VK936_12220 [Longimicrobiales bacterium]|nr:hypothetical protein [Longimicrobiales bacterium]